MIMSTATRLITAVASTETYSEAGTTLFHSELAESTIIIQTSLKDKASLQALRRQACITCESFGMDICSIAQQPTDLQEAYG